MPWFTPLDYVGAAVVLAERERWPRLGLSTTRRALNQLALRCNDEKWAEDDEREAESVLDKDVVKLVLLGVSKHQVDVIVGEVEEDQTG